jgi:uncharacterized protein (TIGR03067 family)
MRRLASMPFLLLLSALAGQSTAQPPADPKQKSDQDLVQGIWVITSLETGGKAEPFNNNKGSFLFSKDKVTLRESTYSPIEFSFSLDPTKTPKSIDLTVKDHVIRGIYKFENDELFLCVSMGGSRPTEFSTKAGTDCERFVMKRSRWISYTEKTGFVVEIPGKPEERTRKTETAAGEVSCSLLIVRSETERVSYLVSTAPLARKLNEKEQDELIDAFKKTLLTEMAVSPSIPPEPAKEFKTSNYSGREWTIATDMMGSKDKVVAKIRIFVSGDKIYGLMVTGLDEAARSRINAERFWDSFKLTSTKP